MFNESFYNTNDSCSLDSKAVNIYKKIKKKLKMCTVYEENIVTDQSCQKWFKKFCAEVLSVVWLGFMAYQSL